MSDWSTIIWPLAFILVSLIVMRQLRDDLGPIFRSMVASLSTTAAKNSGQFAIALGFGLSASLSAFVDVFHTLSFDAWQDMTWHQYATMWAKCFNPFIVAVLAYATQSGVKVPPSDTKPPFPIKTQ